MANTYGLIFPMRQTIYNTGSCKSKRQPYHRPHTSLGAMGHILRTGGILTPLIIPELIKEPERQWRWIRIASVATALVSEGMWAAKIRKEREAAHLRDQECQAYT